VRDLKEFILSSSGMQEKEMQGELRHLSVELLLPELLEEQRQVAGLRGVLRADD